MQQILGRVGGEEGREGRCEGRNVIPTFRSSSLETLVSGEADLAPADLTVGEGSVLGERFKVEVELGSGTFSTVWRCWDRTSGHKVAVKVLKCSQTTKQQAKDEIKLMQDVEMAGQGHPGQEAMVRLLDSFLQGAHHCLVLQLLGPDLLACLHQCPHGTSLHLINMKQVMRQVLQGLVFLHTKADIIHTDIKPENVVLVNPSPGDLSQLVQGIKVKIVDLGNACRKTKKVSYTIGTQEYRAPEVLLQAILSTPVDVWSAACLAFELVTGDYLFEPTSDPKGVYSKDEDHLALVTELIRPLPSNLATRGVNYNKFYSGPSLKPPRTHS